MENERGQFTYHEITSQGQVWRAALQDFAQQSIAVRELLHKPFDEVIFTGCGSTYYLSLAAASVWQTITGTRARAVPASELWLFPETVLSGQETLLVAVSRSGETTETLRAMQVYQDRKGSDILGISVYPDCELVKKAPYNLVAQAAGENSVAQTRSFSSMYLLASLAACLAARKENRVGEYQSLPDQCLTILERYEPLSRQLGQDGGLNQFIFLGSSWNYGLASEVMLKMKEMSLSLSQAFHFLEFRHGPKSVAGPGTLIVGLLSDTAYDQEIKVLEEMQLLGASVLALTGQNRDIPADFVVELGSGLPEISRSILQLPVLQLLAYYRSMVKGLNPDQPANLEAVVRL